MLPESSATFAAFLTRNTASVPDRTFLRSLSNSFELLDRAVSADLDSVAGVSFWVDSRSIEWLADTSTAVVTVFFGANEYVFSSGAAMGGGVGSI